MSWKAAALVIFVFSHLARAGAAEPADASEKEYTGCLTLGFEDASFHTGADETRVHWWVARFPHNFESWLDTVPEEEGGYRTMFVRVIAKVSNVGRFGHLGMGSREIEISEILELRQFQESDGVCRSELPPPPVPHPDSFVDP